MVRFLGPQKGTEPVEDIEVELHETLEELRTVHHFGHLVWYHGQNAVYVGESGKRKLLVIDLESWEDTRVAREPAASTPGL
jgi:hypothetical protein